MNLKVIPEKSKYYGNQPNDGVKNILEFDSYFSEFMYPQLQKNNDILLHI